MKIAHINIPFEENLHLHCAYAGNKTAPLLLFLHGFPEHWGMWEKQLDYFSQHYFVVAPDLRGYNESSKPIGINSYALENLVYDIEVIRNFLPKKILF